MLQEVILFSRCSIWYTEHYTFCNTPDEILVKCDKGEVNILITSYLYSFPWSISSSPCNSIFLNRTLWLCAHVGWDIFYCSQHCVGVWQTLCRLHILCNVLLNYCIYDCVLHKPSVHETKLFCASLFVTGSIPSASATKRHMLDFQRCMKKYFILRNATWSWLLHIVLM